jgi:sulfite exporter TauE/SafE
VWTSVVLIAAFFGATFTLNWSLPYVSPLRRQGYRFEVHPPAGNTAYHFDPSTSWHARGGVRIGRFNATVPLARIDIDERCVAIRSPWGRIVIEHSDVTDVRTIGRLSPGIFFESVDGRFDGVIFWSFSSFRIRQALRWFGWPDSSLAGAPMVPPQGSDLSGDPVRSDLPPPQVPIPAGFAGAGSGPPAGWMAAAPNSGSLDLTQRPCFRMVRHLMRWISGGLVIVVGLTSVSTAIDAFASWGDPGVVAGVLVPLVFVAFGLALLSSADTERAHGSYERVRFWGVLPMPRSRVRRAVVFGTWVAGVALAITGLFGGTSAPAQSGSISAEAQGGVHAVVDEARVDRVRQRDSRLWLGVELAFFGISWGLLADADDHARRPKTGSTTAGPMV